MKMMLLEIWLVLVIQGQAVIVYQGFSLSRYWYGYHIRGFTQRLALRETGYIGVSPYATSEDTQT